MQKQIGNSNLSQKLLKWYEENRRILPWRAHRDPYFIWISEVMLQQTTVAAVIPYYERFLKNFPTVKVLAKAPLSDVLENWAGLGYYSRARNLHKASQLLAQNGFPRTADELIQLPGFGPYTSRAVSSLAFGEPVGVLDGNVIRVLTRLFGLKVNWWLPKEREKLQKLSDQLAQHGPSHLVNNGLMELGATVCTPTNPTCALCPWLKDCQAHQKNLTSKLPLKKPRKEKEVWIWYPVIYKKNKKIFMIQNDYLPFLKGQMIFPGKVQKSSKKPKDFAFRHSITHYDIYIQIEKTPRTQLDLSKLKSQIDKTSPNSLKEAEKNKQWINQNEIKKINPSNLLQKVLQHL